MAKKWLSALLCAALLVSFFSGITLFVAAEELPVPYLWMDTAGGEFSGNCTPEHSTDVSLTPTAIVDGGWGIKLTEDWHGFWMSGRFLADVPAGESASLLVEYYVTETTLNDQLFRVAPAGAVEQDGTVASENQWIDYYTKGADGDGKGNDRLVIGQRDVLVYTYTAAQLAALRDSEFTVGILACPGGANSVYIRSVRLVNSAYVAPQDYAYSFVDFDGIPVSDYYPGVTTSAQYDMTWRVLETREDFAGYTYFKVYGAPAATSRTENKPIYIKLYAAEGCENEAVWIDEYEISANGEDSTWSTHVNAPRPTIQMTDGVGGMFIMGCFNNTLNSAGSLRFWVSDAVKFSRIEVYDVDSYCADPAATDGMTALFHNYKMENDRGITVTQTVTIKRTTCDACGVLLEELKTALPEPYAWLDTADGTLTANRVIGAEGNEGSIEVRQIPDTDEYGIRLDADWSGFWIGGELLRDVPAEQSVTMVVEYYIAKDFMFPERHQLFRYCSRNDGQWKDMYSDEEHLVSRESALFCHTFTAEERAAIGEGDMRFTILGCVSGAEQVYIQSMRLVSTEYVHPVDYTDRGYAFVDFAGQTVCDYYDFVQPYGCNTSWWVCEQKDSFNGYEYIRVFGKAQGDEESRNKPILLKVYATAGYENSRVPLYQIDTSDEDGNYYWGEIPPTYFSNGEAVIFLNACLKNRLNNSGSLRVLVDQLPAIARIEIYDVGTYCCEETVTAAERDAMHRCLLGMNENMTLVGRVEATDDTPGYTGDIYCDTCHTPIKTGGEIPPLVQNGLRSPYVWFDTADGDLTFNYPLYNSGLDPVPTKIDDENGWGIRLTGDWQGFCMSGELFAAVPEGQGVAMAVEYYIADGRLNEQIFRIMPADHVLVDGTVADREQWIDCFVEGNNYNGLNVVKLQETALVTYTYTAAQVDALRGRTFTIGIKGCLGGTDVAYIRSMRIVNSEYVWEATAPDRIDLEPTPQCVFYPDILLYKNSGVTAVPVKDGFAFDGSEIRYVYTSLTHSLLREGEPYCPVTVRFTFREDSDITAFDWQYQTARPEGDAFTAPFRTVHTTVQSGVAEVVLNDAAFTNGLHSTGSLRVPNSDASPVWDSLLRLEVLRLHDHALTLTGVREATCAVTGYSGDLWCATCEETVQQGEELPLLPHKMDGGTVTKQATATEKGEITYTCTGCGMTETAAYSLDVRGGDVDGNNKVDSTDARLILQHVVGKITLPATTAADVDGNGRVDSTDARLVLQYAVGKIREFPM